MSPEQRRANLQRALDRVRADDQQREGYIRLADVIARAGIITEAIRHAAKG